MRLNYKSTTVCVFREMKEMSPSTTVRSTGVLLISFLNIYKLNVFLGSNDCSHQSEKLGNALPRAIDFKRNFKQLQQSESTEEVVRRRHQ